METDAEDSILCTLRFHRKEGARSLLAEIHQPRPFVTHAPGAPGPVTDWGCKVVITLDGVQQARTAYGHIWLSSFLLGVEFVRMMLPCGEEREWVDEEGVEIWCLLPQCIPFSWGYPLYKKIARMSDEAERDYIAVVEKRRLTWELRRKGKDGEEDQ